MTDEASLSPQLTARALERRLKRHVRKARQQFFVVCVPGFEEVLEQELTTLPTAAEVTILSKTNGGISLEGHLDAIYYLHLHLATAHRILWRVGKFLAQSYPMLYDKACKLPWEHYLGFSPSYTVHVTASESYLNHQRGIAECLADAIRARLEPLGLSATYTSTPDTSTPNQESIEIYVRLFQDRCTVSINTSGTHLHKRGYRDHSYAAPLRETLAAAVLKELSLSNYTTLIDPMCGSGTLLIEAALLLRRMPLGFVVGDDGVLEADETSLIMREYGFENLPIFQASKWQRLGREALSAALPKSSLKILGGDINEKAINLTRRHALRAGVGDDIDVVNSDASAWLRASHKAVDGWASGPVLMLCNAPYGQRLGEVNDISTTLNVMRQQVLEHNVNFPDKPATFAVITSPKIADKLTGFKIRKRFRNGGLKVVLLEADSSA